MPRIIKLSVEELENLENGGGVVTAKTINIKKKRFQAYIEDARSVSVRRTRTKGQNLRKDVKKR